MDKYYKDIKKLKRWYIVNYFMHLLLINLIRNKSDNFRKKIQKIVDKVEKDRWLWIMKKNYEEYYKEIVNNNGEYYNKINTKFYSVLNNDKIKKEKGKITSDTIFEIINTQSLSKHAEITIPARHEYATLKTVIKEMASRLSHFSCIIAQLFIPNSIEAKCGRN